MLFLWMVLVDAERGIRLDVAELETRVEYDAVESTHAETGPRHHLEGVHLVQHVHYGDELAVSVRRAPRERLVDKIS